MLVRAHVRRDGRRGAFDPFDRNVHGGERRQFLELAIGEDLEVVRVQVGYRVAIRVNDEGVELDGVDGGAEDRGVDRWLRRRLLGAGGEDGVELGRTRRADARNLMSCLACP